MTILYRIIRALDVLFISFWNRPKIKGKENIPKKGGVIIAPNHTSNWDPLLLSYSTRRSLYYLAKAELFNTHIKKWFFTSTGNIKIERGKGDSKALKNALEALKEGKCVVIFPEGTFFMGPELGKGHTGVARLALGARVPVIPAGIINSDKIMPENKKLPRPKKAVIKFGKAMSFNKDFGSEDNKEINKKVTLRIMKRIAELTGRKISSE